MPFTSKPCLRVEEDNGPRPVFSTLAPFGFVSNNCKKTYWVPANFRSDGASIPQSVMSITGYVGLNAGILHDYLVHALDVTRLEADDVFLEALLDSDVEEALAATMYRMVKAYTLVHNNEGQDATYLG